MKNIMDKIFNWAENNIDKMAIVMLGVSLIFSAACVVVGCHFIAKYW